MTFKNFKNFIQTELAAIEKRLAHLDREKRLLAYTVKISEEQGELSEALLSYLSLQRKDKTQVGKAEMAGEVADVIITASLLAEALGIDFEQALEKKIAKIKKRRY